LGSPARATGKAGDNKIWPSVRPALEGADEAFAHKDGGFIAASNKAEAAAAMNKNFIIVGDFMSLILAFVLRVSKGCDPSGSIETAMAIDAQAIEMGLGR
jgi:hypothetical protein